MESLKNVRDNSHISKKLVVIVGILFIILGYGIVYYITGLNDKYITASTPMDSGWRISYGDKYYMNVTLSDFRFDKPVNQGEVIMMYNVIPANWNYYIPILQLRTINSAVSVYINGQLIYEYGKELYESRDYVGSGYHYIDLGNYKSNDSVKVVITPTENVAFSSIDPVYVTDYTNVSRQMLTQKRLPYMMGNFLVLFGIALMGAGLAVSILSVHLLRIMWIGVLSVCIGVWTLSYYGLLQMYGISLYYCALFEYIAFYISPIPILFYFREHIKETHNRFLILGYKILIGSQITLFVGTILADILKIAHFPKLVVFVQTDMTLAVIYLAIFMIMRLRKDRNLGGIEFLGFFLMAFFIAIDMVGYLSQKYFGTHIVKIDGLSALGAFIFIILMLIAFGIEISIKLKLTTEKEVLYRMAYFDVMTDVKNRRSCEEELEKLSGKKEIFGIYNFDLNDLKGTNDALGHVYGDELIQGFAQILKATFKDIGIIGRMGGDEFIVIVEKMKDFNAEQYIVLLQKNMEEANKKDSRLQFSAAYGFADSLEVADVTGTVTDARKVYELADNRMYENKKEFKKQVEKQEK